MPNRRRKVRLKDDRSLKPESKAMVLIDRPAKRWSVSAW
jgi:hypothetical protein